MKLYFYFLKSDRIETEECEVIEKPKIYKPVTNFPYFWNYRNVSKNQINNVSIPRFYNTVILTESDSERATELFAMSLEDERRESDQQIQIATKYIKDIDRKLKMVEKWKVSNYDKM